MASTKPTWGRDAAGLVLREAADVHLVDDQVLYWQPQGHVALPVKVAGGPRQRPRGLRPRPRHAQGAIAAVRDVLTRMRSGVGLSRSGQAGQRYELFTVHDEARSSPSKQALRCCVMIVCERMLSASRQMSQHK